MLKIASNLIISFIALILFVLFFEFVLFLKSSDKSDDFAGTAEFRNKYIIYNSHGYRDKEYSYQKPNNIFRILVLGDSQTFGYGIRKLEDTWHKKLEALMNQGLEEPRFEIISIADYGWETDTQLYHLFKNGFKYNPDLILLGFYENDVPIPHDFKCDSGFISFFPSSKIIKWVRNNSKVYQFVEFRLNKLLEKLEFKSTYVECINQRFDSRGWDMEKIYLDTILMSSQIKNTHFMMTTIPLIYKLGEEYPIKSSHAKVKKYCNKNEITCVDLYDEGFKGLDYKKLVISKTDNHLNEEGAEIVAKTLYKKLQPLKTYKRLSKFNGAFDLKELLDQKRIIKTLDQRFDEVEESNNAIEISNETDKGLKLTAEFINEKINITKSFMEDNNEFIFNFIFKKDGSFKEKKLSVFKKRKLLYRETIKNGSQIKINKISSFYNGNKTSVFTFNNENQRLFLEKELLFLGPKVSEKIIVGASYGATKALLSDRLLFYLRYGWIDYVNYLIERILEYNPSNDALQVISNIKSNIKTLEKIKKMQRQYKSFSNSFIPLENIALNEK
jgi:lysophospholipase L1-like esterase